MGGRHRAPDAPDDTRPQDVLPTLLCPFAADMVCPAEPVCPSPRERVCIGDDD